MRKELITTKEFMSWGPCARWPESRCAEVIGDGIDWRDILAKAETDGIEDVEWAVARPAIFSDAELRYIVKQCHYETIDESKLPSDEVRKVFCGTAMTPDFNKLSDWPDVMGALGAIRKVAPGQILKAIRSLIAMADKQGVDDLSAVTPGVVAAGVR